MRSFVEMELQTSREVIEKSIFDAGIISALEKLINLCVNILQKGNKIMFAGNGGSAAQAQHLSAELVSRFYYDRPALPSMALTTDTSILTAVGNDYGYEQIFSRQIESNGQPGDVFIGLTTSGKSPNILRAIKTCRLKEIHVVGFTGAKGRIFAESCDHAIVAPSESTPRIQEIHILMGHILCAAIERSLFPLHGDSD